MCVRELIFSIRSIIIEKIPTEEKRGWQEMKDVITVATMRESDAHTIALYVPSRELMYRAAMGVYQAVNWQGKKVAIFTGSGNNGGDGYALAGILADHSVPCCLYQVSEHYSEDGKYYYETYSIIEGLNQDVTSLTVTPYVWTNVGNDTQRTYKNFDAAAFTIEYDE